MRRQIALLMTAVTTCGALASSVGKHHTLMVIVRSLNPAAASAMHLTLEMEMSYSF